jgi:tRNA(fMet)-specific endonuclease VapC
MFLLDTDTYTHLLREHPTVVAKAAQARDVGEVVGTTVITKIEVLRGWFETLLKADERRRFLLAQRELSVAEEALQRALVIPIDERALDHFQYLRVAKGLRRIGRADLLIAAIVLGRDATVVTRNKKDFGLIPRLKRVNWVD